MHRGPTPSILVGVIELDPRWSDHLDLDGVESPWELLHPRAGDDPMDMSEAAELLADNRRLQQELDEQYAILLRARRYDR